MNPDAEHDLVLRQSPYRTVVFVAIQPLWIVLLLHPSSLSLLAPARLHSIMLADIPGYFGIMATIQAVVVRPSLNSLAPVSGSGPRRGNLAGNWRQPMQIGRA